MRRNDKILKSQFFELIFNLIKAAVVVNFRYHLVRSLIEQNSADDEG